MLINEAKADEGRTGAPGFGLAGGCGVVVLAALAVAGSLSPRDLGVRAAAMAVVVAVLAAVLRNRRAVLGVTAATALIFVGFLDHRYGVLTGASAWRYTIPIVLAAVLGRVIASLRPSTRRNAPRRMDAFQGHVVGPIRTKRS